MSLFFKRGERRHMESWVDFGHDGSGHVVTPETATHLVPVFAAIRHILDFCSTLPIDAYRKEGTSRKPVTPPQLVLGLDMPGRPGAVSWLGQAFYGIVTRGNAVGWISETDGFGFPTAVSWLKSDDWTYSQVTRQWYVFGVPVPSSQLLHIPWIVPSGCTLGLSPLEHFAAIIGAGLSAQEYADIKRGGGIPPTWLKNTARTLNPEQSKEAKNRAKSAFAKGEPFVTGQDWDFKSITIPPNHAQFIETLKLTANQTAAIYGIDPTEIGGTPGGSLTYNTEELRQINRAANMRPYLERFERAINRVLPAKQFIKLNTDATIRTDIKTRTEVVGAQIQDGRMSVDEARALEDRPPVPGGSFHNVPAPTREPVNREGETP